MKISKRAKVGWVTLLLCFGLLLMGALRLSAYHPNFLTPYANFATAGYIVITIFCTIRLVRIGLPLNRFGFGNRLNLRHAILVLIALAVLIGLEYTLDPLIEQIFGSPRNLERFSDVEGSAPALVKLLILSWTLAAFGEEFVYRIVLMRGIAYTFGDSYKAQISALIIQAIFFGFIHAYQGPTGITGSMINGLIYGTVTLASRWSIWPAAMTHGISNTIGIVTLYHAGQST